MSSTRDSPRWCAGCARAIGSTTWRADPGPLFDWPRLHAAIADR
jgi:hypothetical protein